MTDTEQEYMRCHEHNSAKRSETIFSALDWKFLITDLFQMQKTGFAKKIVKLPYRETPKSKIQSNLRSVKLCSILVRESYSLIPGSQDCFIEDMKLE